MAYPPNVWNQIKNLSKGDLISALLRDGFVLEESSSSSGGIRTYIKKSSTTRRLQIHYHKSSETFRNKGLLTDILVSAGWGIEDLKRLRLIK